MEFRDILREQIARLPAVGAEVRRLCDERHCFTTMVPSIVVTASITLLTSGRVRGEDHDWSPVRRQQDRGRRGLVLAG